MAGMLEISNTAFAFDGIPPYLSNLKELKTLDISETLFLGELDGSIFAPLQELVYLEMGQNFYNSTLPSEIYTLPKLQAFYIDSSGLMGDVDFLPKMHQAVELWLDDNDLEGPIPSRVGKLTNLRSISATNCMMTGQLPTELGKLTALQQVSVHVPQCYIQVSF